MFSTLDIVARIFLIYDLTCDVRPNYNIAPSRDAVVMNDVKKNRLVALGGSFHCGPYGKDREKHGEEEFFASRQFSPCISPADVLKNINTLKQLFRSGQFLAHSFYLGESMAEVIEQIERLLGPILASLGLSLWDLEFRKEGPRWMLRVYIDREESGVTLNDCEAVSRDLGAALDVEDIIAHAYTLEVSSPGLDRTLTKPGHFSRFAGSAVKIKTYQPISGQKVFRGRLKGMDGGTVIIELPDGAVLNISLGDISKASLEVEF